MGIIVNVAEWPFRTTTAPDGEIAPLGPALAVIVCSRGSAIAKSPNPAIPVAWVLVEVRTPASRLVHAPLLNRRASRLSVLAPGSTSPAVKENVAEYVVKVI